MMVPALACAMSGVQNKILQMFFKEDGTGSLRLVTYPYGPKTPIEYVSSGKDQKVYRTQDWGKILMLFSKEDVRRSCERHLETLKRQTGPGTNYENLPGAGNEDLDNFATEKLKDFQENEQFLEKIGSQYQSLAQLAKIGNYSILATLNFANNTTEVMGQKINKILDAKQIYELNRGIHMCIDLDSRTFWEKLNREPKQFAKNYRTAFEKCIEDVKSSIE